MEGFAAYKNIMKCIEDPYEIYGDYDADMTSNLMVVLEKCNPEKRECKTDEEITEYLKFSYIIVLHNNQDYSNPIDNPSERVMEESFIKWLPINAKDREDLPVMI